MVESIVSGCKVFQAAFKEVLNQNRNIHYHFIKKLAQEIAFPSFNINSNLYLRL